MDEVLSVKHGNGGCMSIEVLQAFCARALELGADPCNVTNVHGVEVTFVPGYHPESDLATVYLQPSTGKLWGTPTTSVNWPTESARPETRARA
jgi:dissimilatory sulfite reductase (desulfoviridin) alpha/beta subunit